MTGRSVHSPRAARFHLRGWALLVVTAAVLLLSACATRLKQTKIHYLQAQELARVYETDRAVAAYKKALAEAEKAVRREPSAQAFTLKGMAEANLGRWREAEESFRHAFSLGFSDGEEWAGDVALLGLAKSLNERGLGEPALLGLDHLLDKSSFKPVLLEAGRLYVDLSLAAASKKDGRDKERDLAAFVKRIEKLVDKDFTCGFFHYLLSQAESHRRDYKRSYEEAVLARELGLPTAKILRDNDNQIVFAFRETAGVLPSEERPEFERRHGEWTKAWGWKDALTPDWRTGAAATGK